MVVASSLTAMTWPFPNPNFIFFTDFDGTITQQDSNDYLVDNIGFGGDKRRQCNYEVLNEKVTFRESFRDMMDSVTLPFPQCIDYLVENITLDPHFLEFYQWALKNKIPVVVVSSGMTPIIRAILQNLIGPDADSLDIISNDVEARPGMSIDHEGGWQIRYRDESGYGHDKSRAIRPYAHLPPNQRPTLFYAGDGVSDVSAAKETNLLFAKKGHDLIRYCVKKKMPFTVFEDWSSIHEKVKQIVAGDITVEEAAKEGEEAYRKGEAGLNGHAG